MFGFGFTRDEKRLLEERTVAAQMMGLPPSQARKQAKQDIKEAIAASKAEGTYDTGPIGKRVLAKLKSDSGRSDMWRAMQASGVREQDVLEWWDIPDVERRLMLSDDASFRTAMWIAKMEEGLTGDEAARFVWQTRPVFGDPTAPPTFADDRTSTMLPVELKLRFMRWSESKTDEEWEDVKREREAFSTMNAYLRDLIGRGGL